MIQIGYTPNASLFPSAFSVFHVKEQSAASSTSEIHPISVSLLQNRTASTDQKSDQANPSSSLSSTVSVMSGVTSSVLVSSTGNNKEELNSFPTPIVSNEPSTLRKLADTPSPSKASPMTTVSTLAPRVKFSFVPLSQDNATKAIATFWKLRYNFAYFDSLSCKNHTFPIIMDAMGFYVDNNIEVFVVYNMISVLAHLQDPFKHRNHTLLHNGTIYTNTARVGRYPMNDATGLRYVLPSNSSVTKTSGVSDTLNCVILNEVQGTQTPLTISLVPILTSPLWRLVVLAYVSSFNSVEEVLHWIAYYQLRGIDHIELVVADEAAELRKGISKVVASGFVTLTDFMFKKNPSYAVFKLSQRSDQVAAMYSSIYRYKFLAQYMIVVDVDEYMVTRDPQAFLPSLINDLFNARAADESVIVNMFMFSPIEKLNHTRADKIRLLNEKKFFSFYRYRTNATTLNAPKSIHRLACFNYPVNVHYAFDKYSLVTGPNMTIYLAHFKTNGFVPPVIEDPVLADMEEKIYPIADLYRV